MEILRGNGDDLHIDPVEGDGVALLLPELLGRGGGEDQPFGGDGEGAFAVRIRDVDQIGLPLIEGEAFKIDVFPVDGDVGVVSPCRHGCQSS